MSTQRERSRGAPRPTRTSQLLRRAAASPRQTSLQWPPSAAEPQRGRAPAPLVAAGPPASPAAVAPPAGPAAVDPPVVTVAVDSPVASASDGPNVPTTSRSGRAAAYDAAILGGRLSPGTGRIQAPGGAVRACCRGL